jgi:hypothetical protein
MMDWGFLGANQVGWVRQIFKAVVRRCGGADSIMVGWKVGKFDLLFLDFPRLG